MCGVRETRWERLFVVWPKQKSEWRNGGSGGEIGADGSRSVGDDQRDSVESGEGDVHGSCWKRCGRRR